MQSPAKNIGVDNKFKNKSLYIISLETEDTIAKQ